MSDPSASSGGPPPLSHTGSSRRFGSDRRNPAIYGSARHQHRDSFHRQPTMTSHTPTFAQLSESQQSATQSAVSMNHLFSEARREIRRGEKQDKLGTPAGGAGTRGDLESGEAPTEVTELDLYTDLAAIKKMLWDDKILSSLLLCIPIGAVAHYTGIGGTTSSFIFNFLAIIPLAWLLGNATEELALRSNQTIGGLLNATFGNAVELIVSVVALEKGMIKLVQASLLGSILSNCLLVLGMSFFLGGLKNKVQCYNQKGAHMLSSLLLLASIALVLPAAFVNSFTPHPTMHNLLMISRITSLIMFVIYILYLYFQLYTHSEMFADDASSNGSGSENTSEHGDEVKPLRGSSGMNGRNNATYTNGNGISSYQSSNNASDDDGDEEAVQPISDSMNELADLDDKHSINGDEFAAEDEEEDQATLTLYSALGMLVVVTILVSFSSDFLVDSIGEVTKQWGVNESFIGIILIPIVGNAAEHWTAITVAMKNKMDLAIGVAIGSSTQIALFLIPFVTLVGWFINQPMSLNFSAFETICLFVSVLMVTTLVKSGESNWLQGVMLLAVYGVISVSFWFHPDNNSDVRTQNHHSAWVPQTQG